MAESSTNAANERDPSFQIEEMMKFDDLSEEKKKKLKICLSPALSNELKNCQRHFAKIDHMTDLINKHMTFVFPNSTTQKIRKVGIL